MTTTTESSRHSWLSLLLKWFIALAVPVLLVIGVIRLIMTPLFYTLEYQRPGFPEDIYGFTQQDRLHYAPYALDYLLNAEPISYLGDLTFPEGRPLYNERELRHMIDVKQVTQAAYAAAAVLTLAVVAAIIFLYRRAPIILWQGLRAGALITLSLIIAIVFMSVFAWDVFFTNFHNLFFAQGTWVFLYSDTLIRLFPEQFWFDAALTIGVLVTLGALLILLLTWRWQPTNVRGFNDNRL